MNATTINYVTGDATAPVGDGHKLIVHCCNDIGAWGAGFVLALSKRWPEPEAEYRGLFDWRARPAPMGHAQFVRVELNTTVANLIGQRGTRDWDEPHTKRPVRYDAISQGLDAVASFCIKNRVASVHMPRIGCGLAGGDWRIIEALIEESLCARGIEVFVYDLPGVTP